MAGSKMLKVTSIIMIVFAGIAAIGSLLIIVGGGALSGLGGDVGAVGGAFIIVTGLIALVSAVFQLVVGILGVKNCEKPEKAQTCFIMGMIILGIGALSLIISLVNGALSFSNFTSLILPGLYTYGAYQLKSNNS